MSSTDRPVLGIFLMLGFCVLAPLGDAMAKLLGGTVPVLFLVFVRFAVQAGILAPVVLLRGGIPKLARRLWWLLAGRTVLHILGIGCMFLALQYLPLADAVAIAFVMPFIMLLLGRLFLDEEVGMRRILACVVGFVGTLLVIQPSFASVGAPALLPLAVAVIFALFILITRMVARQIDPVPLQAVNGMMAVTILLPFVLLIRPEPGAFPPLERSDYALLLALGLLGTFAHLVMTWSLRFAPASTLAPMQYLEIPVAAVVGWAIFREFPNGLALLGIVITISAGLYIILREQALNRGQVPASPPPAPPAA